MLKDFDFMVPAIQSEFPFDSFPQSARDQSVIYEPVCDVLWRQIKRLTEEAVYCVDPD